MSDQQQWTAVRKQMKAMRPGDVRDINGRRVVRLSSQNWEVNGVRVEGAFQATRAIARRD